MVAAILEALMRSLAIALFEAVPMGMTAEIPLLAGASVHLLQIAIPITAGKLNAFCAFRQTARLIINDMI